MMNAQQILRRAKHKTEICLIACEDLGNTARKTCTRKDARAAIDSWYHSAASKGRGEVAQAIDVLTWSVACEIYRDEYIALANGEYEDE